MRVVVMLSALTALTATGAKERAEAAGVQGPKGRRLIFTKALANSTSLLAGQTLQLECSAAFDPEISPPDIKLRDDALRKVKFHWLRNETQLGNKTGIHIYKRVQDGVAYSELFIERLDVLDRNFYSCMAIDGKRRIRSDIMVLVTEPKDPTTTTKDALPSLVSSLQPTFTPDSPPTAYKELSVPTLSSPTPHPGLCQLYTGNTCAEFLANKSVFISYPSSQNEMEEKLTSAFKVISFSNEISKNCEKYALPSICFSTFPICRTPEETNRKFFRLRESEANAISKNNNQNNDDYDDEQKLPVFENYPPGGTPLSSNKYYNPSESNFRPSDFNRINKRGNRHKSNSLRSKRSFRESDKFVISRSTIPLRRVCKKDCELLENELCPTEYAIAKRHPEIGQKLVLEECSDLPIDSYDCLEIGIEKYVDPSDTCYWESGIGYKGVMDVSASGLPCVQWAHQFKYKIADHFELLGHSYCRNPGGAEIKPWCFVEKNAHLDIQLCEVPKCSQKIWFYIITAIALLGVSIPACLICIFCRHRNSKNDTAAIRNINLPNADKNIYGNSRLNSPIELTDLLTGQNGASGSAGSRSNRILRVPQYKLSQIKFVEELGEGAFGKVYKGELMRDDGVIFVAVKALKENASQKTQMDFRREIELISELHHENIVCILGVVLREEPLCMLFEFMAKGDLHEFLVSRAPPDGIRLTPMQFLQIAHHIASGMEYLTAHHYVHRDLAARNCLVADNLIVKISDFGLSRDIYSSDYYRVQSKSLLPVRWMPPESILYGKFTTESDVWSYGIVLWEIYSYGLQPYYGYSNQEVISMVRGRELLQCPQECPRPVFMLMRECWHQTAAKRPSFTTICQRLTELKLHASGAYGDNTSESSSAISGPRAQISLGDPRERVPLISHHSSSNGSLAGSMPRKLSMADSIRSHASTRLMVSSSDVTSGSDNCENSVKVKKSSCASLLEGQSLSAPNAPERQRDSVMKIPSNQPYAF